MANTYTIMQFDASGNLSGFGTMDEAALNSNIANGAFPAAQFATSIGGWANGANPKNAVIVIPCTNVEVPKPVSTGSAEVV